MEELCRELQNEYNTLDQILAALPQEKWKQVTPFDNWTIKEEIGHIAYYDNKATLAVTDPMGFKSHMEELMATCRDADHMFEISITPARSLTPEELRDLWKKERTAMLHALNSLDPAAKHPWYGPPMTAASFATARLMETWAHGQDILDTLGIERTPTPALEHIALLGVKTFGWSHINRNIQTRSLRSLCNGKQNRLNKIFSALFRKRARTYKKIGKHNHLGKMAMLPFSLNTNLSRLQHSTIGGGKGSLQTPGCS